MKIMVSIGAADTEVVDIEDNATVGDLKDKMNCENHECSDEDGTLNNDDTLNKGREYFLNERSKAGH